jgi:AraC family transcriptional regulator, ethanolamine operon transcriptional activator
LEVNSSHMMQENSTRPYLARSMSYGEVADRNTGLGWDLEYRPLKAREYEGYIACQEMGRSSAAIEHVGVTTQCQGEYQGNEIVIVLASCKSGDSVYTQGVDIGSDAALLMNSSCELHAKVPADSSVAQLYICPEVFARSWEGLASGVEPFQFDHHGFLGVPVDSVQSLLGATTSIVHSGNATGLEQDEFLSSMLAILAEEALSSRPDRFAKMRPHARMLSLARARDYVDEHIGEPISLSEVCSAAGVSISTLLRVFREFYDMSPLEYIKVRRLQESRRLLQLADPNKDSVSSILEASGLGSHGRSSRIYRQFYGESPKQTLGYRDHQSGSVCSSN